MCAFRMSVSYPRAEQIFRFTLKCSGTENFSYAEKAPCTCAGYCIVYLICSGDVVYLMLRSGELYVFFVLRLASLFLNAYHFHAKLDSLLSKPETFEVEANSSKLKCYRCYKKFSKMARIIFCSRNT